MAESSVESAGSARHSAVYTGRVEHVRSTPKTHRFSYRTTFLYLDLDELPNLFDGRWLWSFEGRNIANFRRSDYLGSPATPLADAVRIRVEEETGRRPLGPIRLLTRVRRFGWVFNPVSFYYCFDASGKTLEAVVAEITNTPWNERHSYVLQATASTPQSSSLSVEGQAFEFDKAFHVSPFFGMDQSYSWRLSRPQEKIGVWMRNLEEGAQVFTATLELERQPWTPRALRSALIKHPLASFGVWLAIHWQAARLWAKRVPFFTHPAKL